jgi:hypothetical protein
MKPRTEDFDQFLTDNELPSSFGNTAIFGESPSKEEAPTNHNIAVPHIEEQLKVAADVEKDQLAKAKKSEISKAIEQLQGKLSSVPETALDKIQRIIKKGYLEEDFEVYGYTWTLKSLDQEDMISIGEHADAVAKGSGKVQASILFNVAYSIEAIDGINVSSWFPDITIDHFKGDKYLYLTAIRHAVAAYIKSFPDLLISELYSKYCILDEKRLKAVADLKN